MAQQQQQGGGGGDSAYGPVWAMVILFIAGWAIWHYFQRQIVTLIFGTNLFLAKIVAIFTSNLDKQIYLMETADPTRVTFKQLMEVSAEVNIYYFYPACVIFAVFIFFLVKSDVTSKFKKTYDMKKLRAQEQDNWSQIVPICSLDLIKEDISKGPWAMGQSPIEFARKPNLLKKDEFGVDDPQHPGLPLAATIKRADAKALFTMQLGSYWEGFEKLPPHLLALCAVFAARANQDRDGASKLLQQINQSARDNKLNFNGAKALMSKHMNMEEVRVCAGKHAYVLTFMSSLIQLGREDGVLATADFLWLKPLDRRAWYVLNGIGRQTPWVEASGIFAHWRAEQKLDRKSMVPLVEEAVKALELAIKEIKLPIKERMELQ